MPWCGACCELNRCKPVKARVRSVGVVVDPPFFDDLACLLDVGGQVLVEPLVAHRPSKLSTKPSPSVSRARCMPFDITLLLPGQDGVQDQLGAFVADDASGSPRSSAITISSPHATHGPPVERGVEDHQGQAFSVKFIDQRGMRKAPSAHQRVRHEVERPTQIASPGEPPSGPCTESPFRPRVAHVGLFLVEPVELLAIALILGVPTSDRATIAEPPRWDDSFCAVPQSPSSEAALTHMDTSSDTDRAAHGSHAASRPSSGPPRSRLHFEARRQKFSKHLLQRRCVKHQLRRPASSACGSKFLKGL